MSQNWPRRGWTFARDGQLEPKNRSKKRKSSEDFVGYVDEAGQVIQRKEPWIPGQARAGGRNMERDWVWCGKGLSLSVERVRRIGWQVFGKAVWHKARAENPGHWWLHRWLHTLRTKSYSRAPRNLKSYPVGFLGTLLGFALRCVSLMDAPAWGGRVYDLLSAYKQGAVHPVDRAPYGPYGWKSMFLNWMQLIARLGRLLVFWRWVRHFGIWDILG